MSYTIQRQLIVAIENQPGRHRRGSSAKNAGCRGIKQYLKPTGLQALGT
jgi:hypothetical protein